MKSTNRVIAAFVGCMMLVGAGRAVAQDWPQWRGPNRDGKVTGFTAPQTWPQALTQKWKVTVGLGDSTPALVGGKLYVFARQDADEVILCLDAATGKELWKDKYAAQAITGPSAREHSGPRSSPAVADGKVVTLGVGGVVSCLNAADGKLLWRKDDFPKAAPKFFTAMSPIIVDGMAIVHVGKEGDGAVIAYDLASGEPKWKWTAEGPAYASPVLATIEGVKQIITMTEKSVVGLGAADGKLLWQVPFAPQGMAYNAATPIVDGSMVIFTGQNRGTRAVKIEKQGEGLAAKEVWAASQPGVQFSTPVLKDGLLFGLSDKGNLFCINAKDGQVAWTDATNRRNFGAIIDAGSVLMALPSNSELLVYKPDGKQYQELAHIKVADTATYAHPIIAGKNIYVKERDSLTMWTLE